MTRIRLRRDTAAAWTAANPILLLAEAGYETDTGKLKIGNGSSTWSALPYFASTGPGSSGPTGPTGPAGSSGAAGGTGPTGAAGAQGAPGQAGAQGAAGETGPTGPTGASGAAGAAGSTGPTGAQGMAGTAGAAGSQGPTGPTGPTGAAGAAGSAGAAGATGPTGATGASGAAGSAGAAGATGPTGPGVSVGTWTGVATLGSTGTYSSLSLTDFDVYYLIASTAVAIHSIGITGPTGTTKLLVNVGTTGAVTINHATGAAGNAQFAVPWSGNCVLPINGGSAAIHYDGARWRVL